MKRLVKCPECGPVWDKVIAYREEHPDNDVHDSSYDKWFRDVFGKVHEECETCGDLGCVLEEDDSLQEGDIITAGQGEICAECDARVQNGSEAGADNMMCDSSQYPTIIIRMVDGQLEQVCTDTRATNDPNKP